MFKLSIEHDVYVGGTRIALRAFVGAAQKVTSLSTNKPSELRSARIFLVGKAYDLFVGPRGRDTYLHVECAATSYFC